VPKKTPHPLLKRVGTRLRRARQAKGLSQEGLALAAGMHRSYVSGLERGEFNVSILPLARLAQFVDRSIGRVTRIGPGRELRALIEIE
jgi:transcriptional regulator with XRE-family HTH domain